ncbi:class I SAM-dependent methyltransferase [Bradyrhizobium sp. CAR08]
MGFYNDAILPKLCDFAMRKKNLVPYRERAIRAARGRVLEIGLGSGRNLPFYGPSVKQVVGLKPAPKLLEMASRARHEDIPIEFVQASAEAIPLDDRSIDTVVTAQHRFRNIFLARKPYACEDPSGSSELGWAALKVPLKLTC